MIHNAGPKCVYCESTKTEVRRKTAANGMAMIGAQCLGCGVVRGKWLPQTGISIEALPAWDEPLQSRPRKNANQENLF